MADGLSHARKCALDTVTAQIDGSHTDFPLLFTEANLPSEMFDADGSSPAQNGGGDIRFTSDSAGNTDLACEVVSFVTANNPANGTAEIWVKVPNVRDTQADTIYVWYNTPSSDSQPAAGAANGRNAVWSDYAAVLHLDDLTDSTGNTTPTQSNATSGQVGQIGQAYAFNGTDARIDALLASVLTTPFTLQVWGNADVVSGTLASVADKDVADQQYRLLVSNGDLVFSVFDGAVKNTAGNPPNTGQWYMWHGVATSASDREIFEDGVAVSSDATTASVSGIDRLTVAVTADSSPFGFWDGLGDEVRVRSSALSAGWVATEYSNQNGPGTFISVGTPESVAGGVEESIALGLSSGVASSSISAAGGSLSLGLSAGVADQGQGAAVGALDLALAAGIAFSGAASAVDSLSIGLSAGVALGQDTAAQGALNLALNHGQALSGQSATVAAIALGIGHGLSVSTDNAVEESIALGIASGLNSAAVSSSEGSLTLSFEIGLGVLSGESVSEAIALGLSAGVGVSESTQAVAAITVQIDHAIASEAQSSALGAITIGQAIGQAIAGAVAGAGTPGDRTVTVQSQDRTITVRAQTRIIDV